jgi:hypothetical protein
MMSKATSPANGAVLSAFHELIGHVPAAPEKASESDRRLLQVLTSYIRAEPKKDVQELVLARAGPWIARNTTVLHQAFAALASDPRGLLAFLLVDGHQDEVGGYARQSGWYDVQPSPHPSRPGGKPEECSDSMPQLIVKWKQWQDANPLVPVPPLEPLRVDF